MGCFPSREKISSKIINDFKKLYPHEIFTDIDSEKEKRMKMLESLFREHFEKNDGGVLLIDDYVRLDKVNWYHYFYWYHAGKLLRQLVKPNGDDRSDNLDIILPIPEKYANGFLQIISDDEIYALIDQVVKVPHTRSIEVSTMKGCIWKYKVDIRHVHSTHHMNTNGILAPPGP